MAIKLFVIGKTKEDYFLRSEQVYIKRIDKYAIFQYEVIPAAKSETRAEPTRKTEEAALLKRIQSTDFMVLLDETGKEFGSLEFSEQLSSWMNHKADIVFVIGGAFGVSKSVKERADFIMRLSRMTFPHHLVRTLFLEQLYRAFSILRGEKYHNG